MHGVARSAPASGQKLPAGHMVGEDEPGGQKVPAVHVVMVMGVEQ